MPFHIWQLQPSLMRSQIKRFPEYFGSHWIGAFGPSATAIHVSGSTGCVGSLRRGAEVSAVTRIPEQTYRRIDPSMIRMRDGSRPRCFRGKRDLKAFRQFDTAAIPQKLATDDVRHDPDAASVRVLDMAGIGGIGAFGCTA